MGLVLSALTVIDTSQARDSAEFQQSCLLPPRDRNGLMIIALCRRTIADRMQQIRSHTVYLGLDPAFFRCFDQVGSLDNAAEARVRLCCNSVGHRKYREEKRNQQFGPRF